MKNTRDMQRLRALRTVNEMKAVCKNPGPFMQFGFSQTLDEIKFKSRNSEFKQAVLAEKHKFYQLEQQ